MRLLTLGRLDLRTGDGAPLSAVLSQKKRIALLCHLAVREPGSFVQRHAVAALFWPDSTEPRARAALRNALHYLRSVLGPDAILARGDEEIALNPARVWCDAAEFEQLCHEDRLEQALALYRGPLLEGFLPSDLPEFGEWLEQRRRTLQFRAIDAAKTLAERESERRPANAVPWVQRWLELSPYEEPAIRALVHTLLASGNRASALSAYETWSARLARDLDAEPSSETQRMMQAVRAATPTAESPVESASAAAESASDVPFSVTASVRRRRWPATLAAACTLAAAVVALVLMRPEAAASSDPVVAVMPFSYGGGDSYAYLGAGMVELVSQQMGAVDGVRLIAPRTVLGATADERAAIDERTARDIARRLHATHYVLGSILELGGGLQVSASLYDAGSRGAPLSTVTMKGEVNRLFEVVSRVGDTLLLDALRLSAPVRITGTASLAATEAYLSGQRDYHAGQYQAAADAFQRAVDADSTFALAHMALSFAADWTGRSGLQRSSLERALRHEATLTEPQRLLLRAWRLHVGGRPDPLTADSLYGAVLAREPDNAEAWYRLAELRYHWGPTFGIPTDDAAAAFHHALELMPQHGGALVHALRLEARRADAASAQRLAERIDARSARTREQMEARILAAAAADDAERFEALLDPLWEQAGYGSIAVMLLNTYRFDWMLAAARDLLRRENPADTRVLLRVLTAQLEAARGSYRVALEEARSIAAVSPARSAEVVAAVLTLPHATATAADLEAARQALRRFETAVPGIGPMARHIADDGIFLPRALLLRGLLSQRLGDVADVRRAIEQLETLDATTEQPERFARQYAALLRARAALADDDAEGALRALGLPQVQPNGTYPDVLSHPVALERWTRAEALEKLGRDRDALRWYGGFPDPNGADIMFLTQAHLHSARIHERLGEHDDAAREYRAFLRLASADAPEIAPDVARARRYLAEAH